LKADSGLTSKPQFFLPNKGVIKLSIADFAQSTKNIYPILGHIHSPLRHHPTAGGLSHFSSFLVRPFGVGSTSRDHAENITWPWGYAARPRQWLLGFGDTLFGRDNSQIGHAFPFRLKFPVLLVGSFSPEQLSRA
jgi:hypothetical protein